ncbi:MAG: zinc ribbon domain-containing protein [Spirochaetes bacterium]|nr:zinc ribbon domain-containing protein [Spirochaetota bacterium]
MPLYEYECVKCGTRFEKIHGADKTPDDLECPKCKERKPKRLLSLFSSKSKAMSMGSGCSHSHSGGSS